MHEYRVGQPYHPDRRQWSEAYEYNYRGGAHELRLFLSKPSAGEIAAVRSGRAEFALWVGDDGDTIALLFRFSGLAGALGWGDCWYSWHLIDPGERDVPDVDALSPESRALLQVVLVDAGTGIILALRQVTLSPAFTRALLAAIARQSSRPFVEATYDAQVSLAQARYPNPNDLLKRASARTAGGA